MYARNGNTILSKSLEYVYLIHSPENSFRWLLHSSRNKRIHIYVTTTLLRKSIVPLNYKIHDDLQLIEILRIYSAESF